jgi:hypothetical protein
MANIDKKFYRNKYNDILNDIINNIKENKNIENQIEKFIILLRLAKKEIDTYEINKASEIANTGLDCADLFLTNFVRYCIKDNSSIFKTLFEKIEYSLTVDCFAENYILPF